MNSSFKILCQKNLAKGEFFIPVFNFSCNTGKEMRLYDGENLFVDSGIKIEHLNYSKNTS